MATNISPQQAELMLKSGEAILIDVRDSEMYRDEHILYAISIPVDQIKDQLSALSAQPKKIIFQCMKGLKSQQACDIAAELGDKIYNLVGGLNAWKDAGLPTLTTSSVHPSSESDGSPACCSNSISVVRQMQITLGIVLLLICLLAKAGLSILGYLVPVIGVVLIIAGVVGCCPMMKILQQMPWNKK